MSTSVETINDLRKRILAGDEPSKEELAEGIRLLREDRMAAAEASARKPAGRAKVKVAPLDLSSLFPPAGDSNAESA